MALRFYRMAAGQGYAPAQYAIGWLYDSGNGVLQNPKQAAEWYRLAAEQGVEEAQFNLANLYYNALA